MQVRYKDKPRVTGTSSQFNIRSVSEVIVHFDDGDATSEFQRELQVFLPATNSWKDMNKAFADGDIVTDDYNTCFHPHP